MRRDGTGPGRADRRLHGELEGQGGQVILFFQVGEFQLEGGFPLVIRGALLMLGLIGNQVGVFQVPKREVTQMLRWGDGVPGAAGAHRNRGVLDRRPEVVVGLDGHIHQALPEDLLGKLEVGGQLVWHEIGHEDAGLREADGVAGLP